MSSMPLLSILVWLPILGGAVVLFAASSNDQLARLISLAVAVITLVLSAGLYTGFDTSTAAMQFAEFKPWIDTFNINYHLGVDGFSVPVILLTTFTTVLVVIAAWEVIQPMKPMLPAP